MVSPRSCFRIVITGPARGAQALFTVGPALILSASECFSSQCVTRAGMPKGWLVRALAGGGCGTTRGSGRWERAGLQAASEPRGAEVGSDPAGGGESC